MSRFDLTPNYMSGPRSEDYLFWGAAFLTFPIWLPLYVVGRIIWWLFGGSTPTAPEADRCGCD